VREYEVIEVSSGNPTDIESDALVCMSDVWLG